MPDYTFHEEILHNIQLKSPLVHPEDISSYPVIYYLGEETYFHLATSSFQGVVETKKITPEPPFPQAELLPTDPSAVPHQIYAPNLSPVLLPLCGCGSTAVYLSDSQLNTDHGSCCQNPVQTQEGHHLLEGGQDQCSGPAVLLLRAGQRQRYAPATLPWQAFHSRACPG